MIIERVVRWLRKDRWFTRDKDFAQKSLWQWGQIHYSSVYVTSILGVINGMLPLLGMVLTVVLDSETKKPLRLKFERKWW